MGLICVCLKCRVFIRFCHGAGRIFVCVLCMSSVLRVDAETGDVFVMCWIFVCVLDGMFMLDCRAVRVCLSNLYQSLFHVKILGELDVTVRTCASVVMKAYSVVKMIAWTRALRLHMKTSM